MSNKKIPSKSSELFHYAEKYIDLKSLFKDGKPKIRELTDYKIKKIRNALKTSIAYAGSIHYLERDFIKVKRNSRLRKYNESLGLPVYFGGVTINGGAKHNTQIHITKKLELGYIRGEYDVVTVPLNARSEKTLIKSINKHRGRIEREDATYIGSNGNYIRPSYKEGRTPTEKIIEKSLFLFTKYNGMAERGEHRSGTDKRTGKVYDKGVAQRMDKWGFSLMWSKKRT